MLRFHNKPPRYVVRLKFEGRKLLTQSFQQTRRRASACRQTSDSTRRRHSIDSDGSDGRDILSPLYWNEVSHGIEEIGCSLRFSRKGRAGPSRTKSLLVIDFPSCSRLYS